LIPSKRIIIMVIGLLVLEMLVPEARSLKQRRMVINSIKQRLHNKFSVSITELEENPRPDKCRLALAHISNEKAFSNRILSKAVDFVEQSREVILEDYSITFL